MVQLQRCAPFTSTLNGWTRLQVKVDVGAIGLCIVGRSRELYLRGQLTLLLLTLLQILLGVVQRRAAIVLSRSNRRSPDPRHQSLKALSHFGSLLRSGAGNHHRAKFSFSIEAHPEVYVRDIVGSVEVYLGTNLDFKIAFLLEVTNQRVGIFLDIAGIVRCLRRIIGDLHQLGIGKPLRSRKLENAKPDRRLCNQQHPHSIGLGLDLQLHFAKVAGTLQRGYALINFILGEWLPRMLLQKG